MLHNSKERMIEMDISIRDYIINNFEGDDKNTLRQAIEESIKENDEITLPGMGVFFELIWEDADDSLKDTLLELLEERVTKKESD